MKRLEPKLARTWSLPEGQRCLTHPHGLAKVPLLFGLAHESIEAPF